MCVKLELAKFQSCSVRGTFSNCGLNGPRVKNNGKPAIFLKRREIGPMLLLITERKLLTDVDGTVCFS